jgi:hypothetical protein
MADSSKPVPPPKPANLKPPIPPKSAKLSQQLAANANPPKAKPVLPPKPQNLSKELAQKAKPLPPTPPPQQNVASTGAQSLSNAPQQVLNQPLPPPSPKPPTPPKPANLKPPSQPHRTQNVTGTLPCGQQAAAPRHVALISGLAAQQVIPCDLSEIIIEESRSPRASVPAPEAKPRKFRIVPGKPKKNCFAKPAPENAGNVYGPGSEIAITAPQRDDNLQVKLDLTLVRDPAFCGQAQHPHVELEQKHKSLASYHAGKNRLAFPVWQKISWWQLWDRATQRTGWWDEDASSSGVHSLLEPVAEVLAENVLFGLRALAGVPVLFRSFFLLGRYTPEEYQIRALTCGQRNDAKAATRELDFGLVVYPSDQYRFIIDCAPLFEYGDTSFAEGKQFAFDQNSDATKAGRLQYESQPVVTDTRKQDQKVFGQTYESKASKTLEEIDPKTGQPKVKSKTTQSLIWARETFEGLAPPFPISISLKRNDGSDAETERFLTNYIARLVGLGLAPFQYAVKFIGTFSFQYGFMISLSVSLLKGTFSWSRGWKEHSDHRVYFTQAIKISLTILQVKFAASYGVKAAALFLTAEALIELSITGSAGVQFEKKQENPDSDEWKKGEWSFPYDIGAKLEIRIVVGNPNWMKAAASGNSGFAGAAKVVLEAMSHKGEEDQTTTPTHLEVSLYFKGVWLECEGRFFCFGKKLKYEVVRSRADRPWVWWLPHSAYESQVLTDEDRERLRLVAEQLAEREKMAKKVRREIKNAESEKKKIETKQKKAKPYDGAKLKLLAENLAALRQELSRLEDPEETGPLQDALDHQDRLRNMGAKKAQLLNRITQTKNLRVTPLEKEVAALEYKIAGLRELRKEARDAHFQELQQAQGNGVRDGEIGKKLKKLEKDLDSAIHKLGAKRCDLIDAQFDLRELETQLRALDYRIQKEKEELEETFAEIDGTDEDDDVLPGPTPEQLAAQRRKPLPLTPDQIAAQKNKPLPAPPKPPKPSPEQVDALLKQAQPKDQE